MADEKRREKNMKRAGRVSWEKEINNITVRGHVNIEAIYEHCEKNLGFFNSKLILLLFLLQNQTNLKLVQTYVYSTVSRV